MGNKRPSYRLNKEIFLERSNKVHNFKYDYSEVEYVNHRTKVKIKCPIHGFFYQTPKNHMKGQGCPECGKKYAQEWQKNNYHIFLKTSNERFGDIYEFPKIEEEYENSHSKITIKCKKCGNVFIKKACDHITSPNGGCSYCYANKSKPEEDIGNYIRDLLGDKETISFNDRNILKGHEIDIFLPNRNIGIEFNGLFWHRDKGKNYHLLKTEWCESKGIRLIQIFEDEYSLHKEIVFSKLKHILGCDYDLEKIYARKCKIEEIDYKNASLFLERNHIQGKSKSTIYIGAFYNGLLCAVMSFKKYCDNDWELTRFATSIDKRVIGIGGKLFSYFQQKYKPTFIKSFADRRWSSTLNENIYEKLGFELDKVLKPDYKYYMKGSELRHHKFGFRKKILSKKYGFDNKMTEAEMTEKLGLKKIWDCGLLRYVWYNRNV